MEENTIKDTGSIFCKRQDFWKNHDLKNLQIIFN